MAFLKVGSDEKKKRRLYIMEILMPIGDDASGLTVIKIGVASGNSSKERMLQICGSIFDAHRRTPMIAIKRDREVPGDKVFKYEAILHAFFKNYKYNFKNKWSGSTECFVIPLDDAKQAFEAVIEDQVPDFTYVLPDAPVCDDIPF